MKGETVSSVVNRLQKGLNIHEMKDWYKIKVKDIQKNGGNFLLRKLGRSPSKIVQHIYPDYHWELYKFECLPHGYWQSQRNINHFMKTLKVQLEIKEMSDWYKITAKDIQAKGGAQLLKLAKYGGSHFKLLQEMYPDYPWELYKFDYVPWKNTGNHKKILRILWRD